MEPIVFSVAMIAPGINHCYGRTRFGGTFLKPEGKAFKALVRAAVGSKRFNTPNAIALAIELHGPGWYTKSGSIHLRAGDVDGFCKITIDALAEALGFNDAQVFELSVRKVFAQRELTVYTVKEIV